MKIFSGTANKPLSEAIAKNLRSAISPIEIFTFPDGERRIRIVDRIVDENCIVIQPTSPPVDINYMELFFIIDGLKRSGARSVTAVMPYFGYQRQDHIFRDGEAVSLEVIIKILETVGIDKLISVDLHASRIPDLFHIPVSHLSALPLFAEIIKLNHLDSKNSILISPDMGGIRRVKMISELLDNMPFIALEKNRNLDNGDIKGDVIREGKIEGKKIALIIDDMISSGKTISLAANVLKSLNIEKSYAFATHAVFSDQTPKILQSAPIEKYFVTNTLDLEEKYKIPRLEVISISDIIANKIYENTQSDTTTY